MDAVRERIAAEYDYVLIDSRTGVSDTSGICTVQLPDALVTCFTLNNQSIEGAAAVAASVYNQRRKKGERFVPSIFPVPTRIDFAEKDKLELAREYSQAKFDSFLDKDDIPEADREHYWGGVEVLYFPFYSYEEVLATFGDKPGHTNSLLASAERITSYITGRDVSQLAPPSDSEREKVIAQYARKSLTTQSIEAKKSAAAEGVFSQLTAEEQEIARRVFIRLVRLAAPEESAGITPLPTPLLEFTPPAQSVLQMFRFAQVIDVVQDQKSREEVATIADGRLIDGWHRLRGWIEEDRTFLLWRQELQVATAKWERSKRADSALLQGASLDEAKPYLSERSNYLSESEQQFIQASLHLQERVLREREIQERSLREREDALKFEFERLELQREKLKRELELDKSSGSEKERRSSRDSLPQFSIVLFKNLGISVDFIFGVWEFLSKPLKMLTIGIPLLIAFVWYFDLVPSFLHLFNSRETLSKQIAASAQSQLKDDPQLSLLLAIEAAKTAPTPEAEGTLRLALFNLRANTARTIAELADHEKSVLSARFAPDGKLIATASADGTAKVWDITGRPLPYSIRRNGPVNSVRFSPDSRLVVTASDDGIVQMVSLDPQKPFSSAEGMRAGYPVKTAEFSPSGKYVLKAYNNNAAIWDISNWEALAKLPSSRRTWKVLAEIVGHRNSVLSAKFSPDGNLVVTASLDGTARVWDASSGKTVAKLLDHSGPVYNVEFSPDGKLIVTASADGTARVWEADLGSPVSVMRGHVSDVRSAKFSPDGKYVVTASNDTRARIWETTSGQSLFELRGHEQVVNSAEFSPDGQYVVTSSADKTARIWQAATGLPLTILQGHKGGLNSARFSPDGQYILTASEDSTARLYSCEVCIPLTELVVRARQYTTRELTADERKKYLR